jgi:hypothetical protein
VGLPDATPGGADTAPVASDYPAPPAAAAADRPFFWDADGPAASAYPQLGQRLRDAGDIYRLPGYGAGLILASPSPNVPPTEIVKGSQLASRIADRVPIVVIKNGKPRGRQIPAAELSCMLGSELFLGQFRPVDLVVKHPMYLGDSYKLTRPGYNDGGRGQRIYYVGEEAPVVRGLDAINRFLDVMEFATDADRTNAVAGALTVTLRNYWPGGKPAVIVTSTKSHGGKETVVSFIAGATARASISYEREDWALQNAFVVTVKWEPEVGVVNVENVRTDGAGRVITSAFLERFLTDPEPLLYSPGTGQPIRRPNYFVVALTNNAGAFGDDLLNRDLPVHLAPVGDVAARVSPIGNPKHEYLPANRERIEAEKRGMIERWNDAGQPLDSAVRHPFTAWAAVVGGILKVNGFTDFLANYRTHKTVDEPVRRALAQLGAFVRDEWRSASAWVPVVAHLGLVGALIPPADRETADSRRRGLGVTLSSRAKETFCIETDDAVLTLRLEKARRRFNGSPPETRYQFVVVESRALPEDAE